MEKRLDTGKTHHSYAERTVLQRVNNLLVSYRGICTSIFYSLSWITFILACFVLLLFSSAATLHAQNYNPNNLDATKTMDAILHPHADLVIVSSHRGDHALVNGLFPGVPENSLQAIGLSAQSGIEEIELDVKLTSDGVPILSHDVSWGREWCGLSPFPNGQRFDPFTPPGNTKNDSTNPAVNQTSFSDTRSSLGETELRDSISLVTDTANHGCTPGMPFMAFTLRPCRMR